MREHREPARPLAPVRAESRGDDAQALQAELESERLARKELLAALRDAEASAAAMEVRVAEIASRREKSQLRSDRLENEEARDELLSLQQEYARLNMRLAQREAALLQSERNATLEREQAQSERRDLTRLLDSTRESLREAHSRARQFERRIQELEAQVSQGAEYVRGLLEQLAEKDVQLTQSATYARSVEAGLAHREEEYRVLSEEAEAVRKAAISDKVVMNEYVQSLRKQTAEIPLLRSAKDQLIAQTEELISYVQAESTQLAVLIDTVEASHFWKLKRFLNRVRARLRRQ